MTPVWVINLNEDIDVRKRLAENLRKLSREQRHCWRVTNLANRRCIKGIADKDSFDAMIDYTVREGQRMVNYFLEKGFPLSIFRFVFLEMRKKNSHSRSFICCHLFWMTNSEIYFRRILIVDWSRLDFYV